MSTEARENLKGAEWNRLTRFSAETNIGSDIVREFELPSKWTSNRPSFCTERPIEERTQAVFEYFGLPYDAPPPA